MKRMMKSLLVLLITTTGFLTAKAYGFEVDGIYYSTVSEEDLTCKVISKQDFYGSHYSGVLVIPSTVTYLDKTYTVTSIGDYAFQFCNELTSLSIPNSITFIGSGAFYSCLNLADVNIPDKVTEIGVAAFSGCQNLTKLTIPDGVTAIRHSCFQNCSNLSTITLPNSISIIDQQAFAGCGLVYLRIPESVVSIGESAFHGCDKLIYVNIPTGITTISKRTFYDCNSLTSITIPNTVTTIEEEAFRYCYKLTSLTLGTGLLKVGTNAFGYCASLHKLILLPNSVPTGWEATLPAVSSEGRITYVASDNYKGTLYGTIKKLDYLSSYFDVDGVRYVPISPSERTCAAIDCSYDYEAKDIVINDMVSYKGINMDVVSVEPYIFNYCCPLKVETGKKQPSHPLILQG